jgi:hypothetical protein
VTAYKYSEPAKHRFSNTSIGTSVRTREGIHVAQNGFLNLQGSAGVYQRQRGSRKAFWPWMSAQLIVNSCYRFPWWAIDDPESESRRSLAGDNLAMLLR